MTRVRLHQWSQFQVRGPPAPPRRQARLMQLGLLHAPVYAVPDNRVPMFADNLPPVRPNQLGNEWSRVLHDWG